MDIKNVIYAAGYIDGEGCITTSGTGGFRVTVSSTNIKILKWFQQIFGGRINNQHLPSNPKWHMSWKWIVCDKSEVLEFLCFVAPYLKLKQEQAILVIEYLKKYPNRTNRNNKEQTDRYLTTAKKIRELKTSGKISS